MSITNFIERGNPDDMEEQKAANKPVNTKKKGSLGQSSSKSSQNYLIVAIILLTVVASLGLGLLEGQSEKGTSSAGLVVSSVPMTHPATAKLTSSSELDTAVPSTIPSGGEVVGDSATKTYELPWCAPQVAKISNANKVLFATYQTAKAAGYTADASCAGNE